MKSAFSKRWLAGVGACFALALGTACPIQSQTIYPVNGTAGFDTGLRRLANLVLDHKIHLGDANPLGALVHWGDNLIDYGWLVCSGGSNSDPCDVYGTHRYGAAGTYTITIEYDDVKFIGNGSHHALNTTATMSPAGDFVILSIGDSIASGEGNPLIPSAAVIGGLGLWDDPFSNGVTYGDENLPFPSDELAEWPNQSFPCHRSSLAGPAQAMAVVEQNNPGVRFIHYACSGAKIEAGDTPNTAAQDAVGQLRVARGRLPRIDALIISAGSNSLYGPNSFGNGFGGLVNYCLHLANDCDANANVTNDLKDSFNSLPSKYKDLAKEINCINPADGTPEPSCTDPQKQIPKLVLITEYMDPTHDQNGAYPKATSCPGFFSFVDQAEWQFFHDAVVGPLNNAVDSFPAYAAQAGLTVPTYAVTGIADDFLYHGICAGDQRWVYDISESTTLLGTSEPPGPNKSLPPSGTWTNGTGHPISVRYKPDLGLASDPCCGQEDFRDRIYAAVVGHNPPATTVSATVDGTPYPFGTWTNQDVVVTLSASNAIKESGVGATFYGVDNASCFPGGVGADSCASYSTPFPVSSYGKHAVTFFSANTHGVSEAAQAVQVWVDKNQPVNAVPGALNIRQGQSATYLVAVGHVGWDNQTVDLSCKTDAELGTCSMVPAWVSLDDANSPTASAIVFTTRGSFVPTPGLPVKPRPFGPLGVFRILLVLGTALFLLAAARAMRRRRWAQVCNFAGLVAVFAMLCAGCGAGIPGTPRGIYTVTITGTSGMTTNTVQTKLVVQ